MDKSYLCRITARTFTYRSTRVLLISGDYPANEEDPLIGSEYECEGLVTKHTDDDEYPLEVAWDNGQVNQYKPGNLDIIGHIEIQPEMEENNPNAAFRAHKQKHASKPYSMIEEARGVSAIREATGVTISEGGMLYRRYNGDVAIAITRYNLEHGSAAKSIITEIDRAEARRTEHGSTVKSAIAEIAEARLVEDEYGEDVEMSGEEFDEVQSAENIRNNENSGSGDSSTVVVVEEGSFKFNSGCAVGTIADRAALERINKGGCKPISVKEVHRRSSSSGALKTIDAEYKKRDDAELVRQTEREEAEREETTKCTGGRVSGSWRKWIPIKKEGEVHHNVKKADRWAKWKKMSVNDGI